MDQFYERPQVIPLTVIGETDDSSQHTGTILPDFTPANTESTTHAHMITSHRKSSHTTFPADSRPQSNTILQNAQGVNISGNPNFHNVGSITNIYGGEEDGMKHLNAFISYDAQFDSSAQDPDRQCHPGTRENVLKRLRDWTDNPKSDERIFWLYGPAGAGKSAIAQTIARTYNRPTVAATFFFFRSDVNRNNGNLLFTTLAYQIALSMPEMKDYIARSLSKRPDIPRTAVETQFKLLLAHPFQLLHEDATRQLAPAIQVIIDLVEKYRVLAPIVIIDGVDECTDEKLQRRLLKIIGDAVTDDRLPLRFLIVSRPEVHIETTIRHFQTPVLTIDLAKLDDANQDIKKYLVDEFSRIASEQDLGAAWPGQQIVDDIVYKSSGNFIYAAVVIRFVSDPYCFAKTQLEIVMNIKPPKTMSPFAILDQLFLEILRRVPDQDFLKKYLALLVARISVPSKFGELYKDDGMLMHVSNAELHAKLRRMRSLLKFEPSIDIYHKSFIDFLHDSCRSSQYYIPKQDGIRGYLDAFIDSLVQYVSIVIEQSNHHNIPHFTPIFRAKIAQYPPEIYLSVKDWREVMEPLLDLQDKLLQLSKFDSVGGLLQCDRCTVFHLLRELLHLCLYHGFKPPSTFIGEASITNLRKRKGVITTQAKNNVSNSVDAILLSLLTYLPDTMENYSPDKEAINLMKFVLEFDLADTVRQVRTASDAQKLVDLLCYMIHAGDSPHPDTAQQATLLALEIFARVPIVPPPYLFKGNNIMDSYISSQGIKHVIEMLSQTIFANSILDRRYIVPTIFPSVRVTNLDPLIMFQWRQNSKPSSETTFRMMLQLAKAIQYLHSIDVVLHRDFSSQNVILDSNLCPKICCWYSTSSSQLDTECKERFSPEENIFSFGCILHEAYTGIAVPDGPANRSTSYRQDVTKQRPSQLEIPEAAFDLIQRCCAERVKNRPTINEIVTEMEGWCAESQSWQSKTDNLEIVTEAEGQDVKGQRGHVKAGEVVDEMNVCGCFGAMCRCPFISKFGRKWFSK